MGVAGAEGAVLLRDGEAESFSFGQKCSVSSARDRGSSPLSGTSAHFALYIFSGSHCDHNTGSAADFYLFIFYVYFLQQAFCPVSFFEDLAVISA